MEDRPQYPTSNVSQVLLATSFIFYNIHLRNQATYPKDTHPLDLQRESLTNRTLQ